MTIEPIKTERDYEARLKEIDAIMDAQPHTPGGDPLDVLVTLMQAWEDERHVIQATTWGT